MLEASVDSLQIRDFSIGVHPAPVLIAGMCVIESEALVFQTARALKKACEAVGWPLIFKASFDKANRSAAHSFRGPGLDEGLRILAKVKAELELPITTDVHEPNQATTVAEVADLLQVPAFLCRQTDLLLACAQTGRPVNVKKGQFMAPWDMKSVIGKLRAGGCEQVMLTERGSSFGYNRLVVDMAGLSQMRALGVPVCFDATHATQLPGAGGDHSGGNSELADALARAAVAVGVDAVFMECHPDPSTALSDAATALPLERVPLLLKQLDAIDDARRGR